MSLHRTVLIYIFNSKNGEDKEAGKAAALVSLYADDYTNSTVKKFGNGS